MLIDAVAERGVLSGIYQYGANAYYDVADILQDTTFQIESNSVLFKCLKHAIEKRDVEKIDIPTIHASASDLGFSHFFQNADEARHLQAIISLSVQLENVRKFAAKIRKLEVARLLNRQLGVAQDKLRDINGDESVTHILGIAEDAVFDFSSLLNDKTDGPKLISEGLVSYLEYLGEHPVEQLGISTGLKFYDQAIGGGLRGSTINIIGARPGVGKTTVACNVAWHIAEKLNIPVLFLDTEMIFKDHVHKNIAAKTEVSVNDIETGKYAQTRFKRDKVINAAMEIESKNVPYYHKSIAGMQFEDQIAFLRRWITKDVGLNKDGTAKPCVIIYDYLKLMDTQGISSDMKEYQLLGFMMTTLHNFATRYNLPALVTLQLTRDGITKESTDVASGSDRIVWLCSNLTIFKEKSDEEIAEDGNENGNMKLVPLKVRHGGGLQHGDYINCEMKGWCAKIEELKTKFQLEEDRKVMDGDNDGFVVDGEIPFN